MTRRKPKYRSKFEADVHSKFKNWEYEVDRVEYREVKNYIPDFTVREGVYIETKGWFKATDRRKMLLLKEQHPDKIFILYFQNSSAKLAKGSQTTYAEWAERNGFLWCDHRHPIPSHIQRILKGKRVKSNG